MSGMTDTLRFTPRDKRIGLIVPSSNTNVEPDCLLLAPPGVTFHSVRSGGYDVDAIPDSGEMRRFASQSIDLHVKLLTDARVDVVAYACTSATLSGGPDFDQQFCRELAEKAGCPAVTAAGAVIEAIRSLGASRIAFTSPYVPALSSDSIKFIQACGIEVVSEAVFETELTSLGQNALTPRDAYDMALRADCPDADAVVISCTDYRALEAVTAIERTLGKPVITSNQALMFSCLSRLGLPTDGVEAGGCLFTRSRIAA